MSAAETWSGERAWTREAERSLYNILGRSTGSRSVAKRILRSLRDQPPPEDLKAVRELLLSRLESTQTPECLLGRIPTPELDGHFSTLSEVRDVESLPEVLRLLCELVFVERRPLEDVAAFFATDVSRVTRYVVVALLSVSEVDVGKGMGSGTCSLLPRVVRVLRTLFAPGPGSGEAEVTCPCTSCSRAEISLKQAIRGLSADRRWLSLSDGNLIRRAREGPRVKPARPGGDRRVSPRSGFATAPTRARCPEAAPSRWRIPLAGILGMGALLGSAVVFGAGTRTGVGPEERSPRAALGPERGSRVTGPGRFTEGDARSGALIPGKRLTARDRPVRLLFPDRGEAILEENGTVLVLPEGLALLEGSLEMDLGADLDLQLLHLSGRATGRVWVLASGPTTGRIHVHDGRVVLYDPDGRESFIRGGGALQVRGLGAGDVRLADGSILDPVDGRL